MYQFDIGLLFHSVTAFQNDSFPKIKLAENLLYIMDADQSRGCSGNHRDGSDVFRQSPLTTRRALHTNVTRSAKSAQLLPFRVQPLIRNSTEEA
jgi:hypothetical protein